MRVPDDEWQRWGAAAKADGKTLTMWARELLNRAAKRSKPIDE